jgi:hypothetical protein
MFDVWTNEGSNALQNVRTYKGADAMLYVWPHHDTHCGPHEGSNGRANGWTHGAANERTIYRSVEGADGIDIRLHSWPFRRSDEGSYAMLHLRPHESAYKRSHDRRVCRTLVRSDEGADRQARNRESRTNRRGVTEASPSSKQTCSASAVGTSASSSSSSSWRCSMSTTKHHCGASPSPLQYNSSKDISNGI